MSKTTSERFAEITGVTCCDAICYSGYRAGQSPRSGIYPTYEQIREDLAIVRQTWKVIRIYDASPHGINTLDVVRNEFPEMRVLLGADLNAELYNPACAWAPPLTEKQLAEHRRRNDAQIRHVAATASAYADIVLAVSAGNEVTADWAEHLVPTERVAGFLQYLRSAQPRPVTLCDNNVPWLGKIRDLVPLVDFISFHSYPAWTHVPVDQAMAATDREFDEIATLYPDKPVIITEAGWTTCSNGRVIKRNAANEESQALYCAELASWSRRRKIPVFLFEAFDEPWKGSDDQDEPEKHWGFFRENRSPKPVIKHFAQATS